MWEDLNMKDRAAMIRVAVKNGVTNLEEIRDKYNKFEEGGPLKKWKALQNIDFEAIPDTTFTRDKTGAGSIEYFQAKYPQGITYPNGYHKEHPKPGKDVILYNPNENDEQDIRLDALHIMPKDATYDVLNELYRNAAKGTDVEWIARQRYEEDVRKYGTANIDSYESYFNNEADGLLRNMFIEGTPEYIKSKRYYPDKEQLAEWNKPLLGYISEIRKYLETGERPQYILPEVVITPSENIKDKYNKFDDGGIKDSWKPWYWFTPKYEASSLEEALLKAYNDGLEGKNILYKGNAYKVKLRKEDLKTAYVKKQHDLNKEITPAQVANSYIDNVVWTMENPTNKGLRNGLYYPYEDKDSQGKIHYNIGAGIESNSDIAKKYKLDYSGRTGYKKEFLNEIMQPDLEEKAKESMGELLEMYPESDTVSLGNRLILLDIAHNVRPRGRKRGNMPKRWPSLSEGIATGNYSQISSNTDSGSRRRSQMRNDLIFKNDIDPNTVKNR